jgi:hypothetical protein
LSKRHDRKRKVQQVATVEREREWGVNIPWRNYTNGGRVGAFAAHQVQPKWDLPNNTTIFAPTLIAPNNCSLETHIAYYRPDGISYTTRLFRISKHNPAPDYSQQLWYNEDVTSGYDGSFYDKYVRNYPEGDLYYVEVLKETAGWQVYMYNFHSGWEKKGNPNPNNGYVTDGWDMAEIIWNNSDASCLSIPRFSGNDVQVYDGYGWKYCGTSDTSTTVYSTPHNAYSNTGCTYSPNGFLNQYWDWYIDN